MSKQTTPQITRPTKNRFLGLSFSRRQIIVFILVFGVIGAGVLYKTLITRGANYSWLQTSWSGGASTTATASHTNNQTGWTYYYSKDSGISAATPGELTLSAQTASTTDTTDADFNAGTASNTYVSGDTVYLKKPNGVACTSDSQCTSGKCSTTCRNLQVGDSAGGGIVFAISGGVNYVARTADDSTSAQWGCYNVLITGADSTTNGAQNTIDIVNGCAEANRAARICSDLSSGGYADWYLPAKDQLNTMYSLRATIGGFTTNLYWSSTEGSSGNAWSQFFFTGYQFSNDKYGGGYVRCIRSY